MKCPNCAAAAPEGSRDCPSCGVLFDKLKALREREKKEAAMLLAQVENPPPAQPAWDPWWGRIIAGAVVMAWLTAVGIYVIVDMNRRAEKTLPPGTIVPARR